MNTSKNWLWVFIIIVVLALLWAAWQYGFFNRPVTKEEMPLLSNDTTSAIDEDLNTVDVGNPDQDLKKLDADLNQL